MPLNVVVSFREFLSQFCRNEKYTETVHTLPVLPPTATHLTHAKRFRFNVQLGRLLAIFVAGPMAQKMRQYQSW